MHAAELSTIVWAIGDPKRTILTYSETQRRRLLDGAMGLLRDDQVIVSDGMKGQSCDLIVLDELDDENHARDLEAEHYDLSWRDRD